MFHSPKKIVLYTAYRIDVEHATAAGDTKTINGTAFYVQKGSDLFLITNRHNVDAPMKDIKYAGYKPTGLKLSGYFGGEHLVAELVRQELSIGYPPNNDEDVAAIYLTDVQFAVRPSKDMTATFINYNSLATDEALTQIDICDMVAVPGYPDFYDRNGDRPIMRMGTVASDPNSDYRDSGMPPARRIAYEAFSSAGSSGSPVFALEKGFRVGPGLSGGYHRDLLLLGVNAGHLAGRDEMNSNHAGISYCFKSSCIMDAIVDAARETVGA
jgi:hypothetical protein